MAMRGGGGGEGTRAGRGMSAEWRRGLCCEGKGCLQGCMYRSEPPLFRGSSRWQHRRRHISQRGVAFVIQK